MMVMQWILASLLHLSIWLPILIPHLHTAATHPALSLWCWMQKIRRSLQGLLPLLLQVLLIKLFSSFFISSSILLFPPAFLAGRLYRKSRAHFSHAQFPDCFQSALALVTILYDSLYRCQMSVQKIQHFFY